MRTTEEMMKLIMDIAINDDRIRAVTMEGSRVSPNATHDQYCDFDITYVVSDIREFTKDKSWVECFGEILIDSIRVIGIQNLMIMRDMKSLHI